MGLDIDYEDGQTPLDEDEKEGLLISSVTTRQELDEVEQRNIEKAFLWLVRRRKKFAAGELLSKTIVKELHRQMFGEVWKWAGQFRESNKNIGVDKFQIGVELRQLLDDGKFWVENQTFSPQETAIRIKHRLVSIHCFVNGNGRHSRLYADLVAEKIFNLPPFTWGRKELIHSGDVRKQYLQALKNADRGNYHALIEFSGS